MRTASCQCRACGIEFEDRWPWAVGNLLAATCPVCGTTVVERSPNSPQETTPDEGDGSVDDVFPRADARPAGPLPRGKLFEVSCESGRTVALARPGWTSTPPEPDSAPPEAPTEPRQVPSHGRPAPDGGVVNYRSYPLRHDDLTAAGAAGLAAAGAAAVLYVVALILLPVEGAQRPPPRPAVLHLVYGLYCGWCWAAVPLLAVAGWNLADGRNRPATALALAAAVVGVVAHLDFSAVRNAALAGGFFAWQAAVLVVAVTAAVKWAVVGAQDPAGE